MCTSARSALCISSVQRLATTQSYRSVCARPSVGVPYPSVVCSPIIIFIGLPLGILGIVAASLHLFESCRGRASIVGSVVTIKVLAAVIATLEFSLAGILLVRSGGRESRE